MPEGALRIGALIFGFTVASGVFDSLAFTYAASMWQDGKIAWPFAIKAITSFFIGILMYFMAIRYLGQLGIVLPEVQTLIWFGVTILGVAILGGRALQWPLFDQVIAANVLVSLGWLITRTSA